MNFYLKKYIYQLSIYAIEKNNQTMCLFVLHIWVFSMFKEYLIPIAFSFNVLLVVFEQKIYYKNANVTKFK